MLWFNSDTCGGNLEKKPNDKKPQQKQIFIHANWLQVINKNSIWIFRKKNLHLRATQQKLWEYQINIVNSFFIHDLK